MSQYLLRFDGVNDRVDWGRTTAFPTVNAVVEVEIELKSLTGTYQTFVGSVNGNAASDAFFLLGVNASGNPFLQCGGSGLASAKSVTGVSPLALNTKYTVRAEFAGMSAASNANQGTASLYINGVLIGTFTPNSRPFRDTNIGIGVLGIIDTSLFPANFDLYSFTFQTDTENRFYDPSASNGTGTTLFDTQSNNNGTLVNFDVPACWVLIPGGGPVQQDILPTGLPSAEAFGLNAISLLLKVIQPTGIASQAALGAPTVQSTGTFLLPQGIPTGELLGSLTIAPQAVSVGALSIPTQEAFGSANLLVGITVIGVPSVQEGEVFGALVVRRLQQFVQAAGIASAEAFGRPIFTGGNAIVIPVESRATWTAVANYLRNLGYQGSTEDVILQWLNSEGFSADFNDAMFAYLGLNTSNTGAFDDRWKAWRENE